MSLSAEDPGLLVKADVAWKQTEAEQSEPKPGPVKGDDEDGGPDGENPDGSTPSIQRKPRRYYGTVVLDSHRVGRDASRIAEEVMVHLVGQVGAEVKVTLEIEASLPEGASEQVVRTVTENARSLKFTDQGFEND